MKISEIQAAGTLKIVSREGEEVGELSAIHVLNGTEVAALAQVEGATELGQLIIPILRASSTVDELKVPYDIKSISNGPRVSPDALLTTGETKEILEYYGEHALKIADRHQTLGKKGSLAEGGPSLPVPIRNLPPRVLPTPSFVEEEEF